MSGPFRCAASSVARAEPVIGTASTVRAFLLVEDSGPWGSDALRDSRLPTEVRTHLQNAKKLGIRPLLIRRHGRSRPGGVRIFAAYAEPDAPWMQAARLDAAEELLDLDLEALAAGASPGLPPHPGPLFCVCTHGRHDTCCAERGRPVAAALSRSLPRQTWEVSHIGGDRFAGNVLVLPDGLYYGRVEPTEAAALARRHLDGHLELDRLRGRSGYCFAVQAAEWFLRSELGETALHALRFRGQETRDDRTDVVFAVGDQSWRVMVRTRIGPAEQLTCQATRLNGVPQHELVALDRET